MRVRLITPAGSQAELEAEEVLLPTLGGSIAVRGGHTELVAPLGPGEVIIHTGTGEQRYGIQSGSINVTPSTLTIVTPELHRVSS